jgi:hypothetical protein
MKMAPREMRLAGITLAIVVLAGTYWWLEPSLAEWGAFGAKREAAERRKAEAQHLLASREGVEARMAEFLEGLPVYPEGKKAESTLMPALEALAGDLLTRREVGAEKPERDLYETAITCHWEGSLERLVKFLWAQQSQGVASDLRQLSIQTSSGEKNRGKLSGRFTVNYAYRRSAEGAAGGDEGRESGEAEP